MVSAIARVLIGEQGYYSVVVVWASFHTTARKVMESGRQEELSCTSTGLFLGTGYSQLPSSRGILQYQCTVLLCHVLGGDIVN